MHFVRTFGGSINWILPDDSLLVSLLGRRTCLAFVETFHAATMSPTIVPSFELLDRILGVVAVAVVLKVAALSTVATKLLVATAVSSKVIVVGTIVATISPALLLLPRRLFLLLRSCCCCCGGCWKLAPLNAGDELPPALFTKWHNDNVC